MRIQIRYFEMRPQTEQGCMQPVSEFNFCIRLMFCVANYVKAGITNKNKQG